MKYITTELKKNALIININEPSPRFYNELKKTNVEITRVTFIDAISKKTKEQQKLDNCIFIESPESLEELSSVITEQLAKKKFDYLFIDSLSTFAMYNEVTKVKQFIYYTINKVKTFDINGIFLMTKDNQFKDLASTVTQVTDRVVDLTKL